MTNRKRTKTEDRHLSDMMDTLREQEIEMLLLSKMGKIVPTDWDLMDDKAPIKRKKIKLTISLDADVVEWFRYLGRGYQPRMNAILRAYMDGVLSREVECNGNRDWRDTLL